MYTFRETSSMMYEVFHHFTRSALSFEYDGSVPLLAGKVCALIPLIRSWQDQDHKTIRPSSINPNHGTGSTGQARSSLVGKTKANCYCLLQRSLVNRVVPATGTGTGRILMFCNHQLTLWPSCHNNTTRTASFFANESLPALVLGDNKTSTHYNNTTGVLPFVSHVNGNLYHVKCAN